MAETVMFALCDLERLVSMSLTQVEHCLYAKPAILRQVGQKSWDECYLPRAEKALKEGGRYLDRAMNLQGLLTNPQEIYTASVMVRHMSIRYKDLTLKLASGTAPIMN